VAKARGARIAAFVNDEASPLFALADHALPLCAGPERAVAATKSFIATLSAVLQLCALWSGRPELAGALVRLPSDLSDAAARDWSPMAKAFRPASSLFVLGRGLGLGVAGEMALKLKETASIHAEAFSSAEMQHGPMTLVKPGFPVLAIGQTDAALASVKEAAALLAGRGARVLTAGFSTPGAIELPSRCADPAVEPILLAQSFYPAASDLSVMRGLNPDAPPHLSKVTETL
jgi:glucosamine--fructose-6-phosphate aminotransferase (isomerizing)